LCRNLNRHTESFSNDKYHRIVRNKQCTTDDQVNFLYSGQYDHDIDQPQGIGRAVFSDSIYEGQHMNGHPSGFGRLMTGDGSYYVGYFKDIKAHGYGKFFRPDGTFQ
jgi:hypothetical protein